MTLLLPNSLADCLSRSSGVLVCSALNPSSMYDSRPFTNESTSKDMYLVLNVFSCMVSVVMMISARILYLKLEFQFQRYSWLVTDYLTCLCMTLLFYSSY